jgi:DNA-binding LacI/PurR family transcriptional regulator
LTLGIFDACERVGVEARVRRREYYGYPEMVEETQAQGLIVIRPYVDDLPALIQMQQRGVPVVLVGADPSVHHLDDVVSDFPAGMTQLIDHLVGLGHRDIGCVVLLSGHPDGRMRLAAFRDACMTHNLEIPYRRVCDAHVPADKQTGEPFAEYQQRVDQWLDEQGDILPTAIVAGELATARALLAGLAARNKQVPSDISLAHFDDRDNERLMPPMTLIQQDPRRLGITAVERLIRRVREDLPPEIIRVPTYLRIQSSTAGPSSPQR